MMPVMVQYLGDLYGDDTDWQVDGDRGGIGGLHSQKAKTADMDRAHGDGEFKGPHYLMAPVLTIPLFTANQLDTAGCLDLIDALVATWALLPFGTLEQLVITLPGRTYTVMGAPLSIDIDDSKIAEGDASAFCSFKVYDAQVEIEPA